MEDIIDALSNEQVKDVILALRDVTEPDEFRYLINVALNLEDINALWYFLEVGSKYDDELEDYFLEQCGLNGQTIPCGLYPLRNPLLMFEEAVQTGNKELFLYSLDLLSSPLNAEDYRGYSSQDYQRIIDKSQQLNDDIEIILRTAQPSFLEDIFVDLPKTLQVRLK